MVALIEKLAAERTILLVEHKMKMVLGLSDRILVLHHGRHIADGSAQHIRRTRKSAAYISDRTMATLEIVGLTAW